MSTSPYSKDLRTKVINYIAKGKSQKEAAEVFGLHRNTVNRWCNRNKREGSFSARVRVGAKRRLDLKALISYVESNENCKLSDIADKFNITIAWASISLRRLGFSYKKKPFAMWKRVKKSEQNI